MVHATKFCESHRISELLRALRSVELALGCHDVNVSHPSALAAAIAVAMPWADTDENAVLHSHPLRVPEGDVGMREREREREREQRDREREAKKKKEKGKKKRERGR